MKNSDHILSKRDEQIYGKLSDKKYILGAVFTEIMNTPNNGFVTFDYHKKHACWYTLYAIANNLGDTLSDKGLEITSSVKSKCRELQNNNLRLNDKGAFSTNHS